MREVAKLLFAGSTISHVPAGSNPLSLNQILRFWTFLIWSHTICWEFQPISGPEIKKSACYWLKKNLAPGKFKILIWNSP